MPYYLGIDLGGTKTHSVITDEYGQVVGFGGSGPGNHQNVGYEGMYGALNQALQGALTAAQIDISQINRAGFGIAGFDWPYELPEMKATINRLGLSCEYNLTNDAIRAHTGRPGNRLRHVDG
jgi:N-acetylglucosamine kinase-like BadF-type ATPase